MTEQLPFLAPDTNRSDRTRARCHKALARRFRPREQRRFVIERGLFLGFGAIYLSSLALNVVRMLVW